MTVADADKIRRLMENAVHAPAYVPPTHLETVKAAIAETPFPEVAGVPMRDLLGRLLTNPAMLDHFLNSAARRAIEAMPITDAMVEAALATFNSGHSNWSVAMRAALEAAKASAMEDRS